MKKLDSRFVLSMNAKTKSQLNKLAEEQGCSAASVIRRLIHNEYQATRQSHNDVK